MDELLELIRSGAASDVVQAKAQELYRAGTITADQVREARGTLKARPAEQPKGSALRAGIAAIGGADPATGRQPGSLEDFPGVGDVLKELGLRGWGCTTRSWR